MEKRSRLPLGLDPEWSRVPLDPTWLRAVTCVDTDPGDTMPHVTLACGHGIYLCGETLVEAQARCAESRFCSQCLNEWCTNQRVAS